MKNIFITTLLILSYSYLLAQSTFGNCAQRSDGVNFCVEAFVPSFTCNEIGSPILNVPFRSHYRYRYETYAPTGVVTYDMSTTVYLKKGNLLNIKTVKNNPIERLSVYDAFGRLMTDISIVAINEIHWQLEVEKLIAGNYIVHIVSNKMKTTKHFVVAK